MKNKFQIGWSRDCGGSYVAEETPRVLRSPGFPVYRPNLKCIYNITAPKGKYIALNFTNFLLENGKSVDNNNNMVCDILYILFIFFLISGTSNQCSFDNLTLISNNTFMEPISEVYCGNKSPGFKRYKDKVNLLFMTDTWVARSGFSFYYSIDCKLNDYLI